jgi:myo-inositol-1(or 4)-monophosphatase
LKPWDVAAGLLMVREAGGYATDFTGAHGLTPSGDMLAANDHLHPLLMRLVADALRAARVPVS